MLEQTNRMSLPTRQHNKGLLITFVTCWCIAGTIVFLNASAIIILAIPILPVFVIPFLIQNHWFIHAFITAILNGACLLLCFVIFLKHVQKPRLLFILTLAHFSLIISMFWNTMIMLVLLAGPK